MSRSIKLWYLVCFFLFSTPAFSARVINSVTVNGVTSAEVAGGDTVTVSVTVTTSGRGNNDNWDSTSYTLDGTTTCVNTTDYNGDGTYTESFSVTAPAAIGTYPISVYAHRNGNCRPASDSNEFTLSSGFDVTSGAEPELRICSATSSTEEEGTLFDSGGSSGNYSNNETCTFLIQPTSGDDITLDFESFDIENFFDTLEVYDGTSTSGTQLADLTGSSLPDSVTATSGSMFLVFDSDFSITDVGFEVSWSTSEPLEAGFIISGQDSSVASSSGRWSWDGTEHQDWRRAIEDTDNFGPDGIVSTVVDTVDLPSITADSLAGIDAFVSSWWSASQSSSYESIIIDFFLAGGDLVLFQDSTATDGIGTDLGISTTSGQSGSTTVTSPLDGSFGSVGTVAPRGQEGRFSESAITSRGGTVCGTDGFGRPTIACWAEGEYAAGAGTLVIVGDVDFVTSDFGGANYSSLNDKGRLGLNIIEFLINDEPTTATTDHFSISHSGTGVTCSSTDITITAMDSSDNVDTSYTGTISLSTSTGNGDWSGGATPIGSDAGTASYTFVSGDNGSVALTYQNTYVETVSINVSDGVISETTGIAVAGDDPDLVISGSGFIFSTVPDTVAAADTTSVSMQAVRSSDSDPSQCEPVFTDGSDIDIELAAECANPSSCIAGQTFSVSNNGSSSVVTLNNDNSGTGATSYTSRALRFGTNSTATLTLNYTDVGEVQLHARYDIPLGDGSPSGNLMEGSSNTFVSFPDSFSIVATGNPGASDHTGDVYRAAGAEFPVTVEVLNSAGNITPNYGLESTPESIAISSSGVAPSVVRGDHSGSVSRSSGGTFTGNLSWDEVGIMSLSANVTDGDYLGSGQNATGSSGNIGRFIPSGFIASIAADSITEGCDQFTYIGQEFTGTLEVTAVNSAGSTVENYEGSYAFLGSDYTGSPATISAGGITDETFADVSSRLQVEWESDSSEFTDGVAEIDVSLELSRNSTSVETPLTISLGLDFADNDGVGLLSDQLDLDVDGDTSNDYFDIGGTVQLFGRLRVSGNQGPESRSLSVPFVTEVWNSSLFLQADDSCTSLSGGNIEFDGTNILTSTDVNVGSGTTTGSFLDYSGGEVTLIAGDAGLIFSAPGSQGSFDVDVDLTSLPWLQYDWNQNADSTDDTLLPSATVTFGSYRGHDRIILWQELFQ